MTDGWHKIKKILHSPLSYISRRIFNLIRIKLLTIKKINLSDEINLSGKQPAFPKELLLKHIQTSKETADKICDHKFDLLGSGLVNLGKKINWQKDFDGTSRVYARSPMRARLRRASERINKDIKVPWELSRFQFLPFLGASFVKSNDEKYAEEAKNLILDWISNNPFGKGVNWQCTMEVSIRACNFALTWHFLKNSPAWRDKNWEGAFFTSIVEHGKFIYRNLEYGRGYNSNHLLADFTGLIFLGILFPDFRESKKWLQKGLRGLENEILNQAYEDGVDYEASIPYHRLVCEFFGYSALLCKLNKIELSGRFGGKLEKMFEFVWHYTKPNGLAPQIGDSDDGRLFVFEDFYSWERRDHQHLFWLAAELFSSNIKFTQETVSTKSLGFNFGKIYIMRTNDFYCIADCGDNGQNGNGGHAHNDTLSFELNVGGEDFIVDPGTYAYTGDPTTRNRFRSTRMHNTVMADNQEMNRFIPYSVFEMRNDAKTQINKWESNETKDILDAQHNGYKRLPSPLTHRRIFEFDKNEKTLKITDSFFTKGSHDLEWNFHFAPEVVVEKNGKTIIAERNNAKLELKLPENLAKHAEIRKDSVSPRYGVKEKAKTLTIKTSIEPKNSRKFIFIFNTT